MDLRVIILYSAQAPSLNPIPVINRETSGVVVGGIDVVGDIGVVVGGVVGGGDVGVEVVGVGDDIMVVGVVVGEVRGEGDVGDGLGGIITIAAAAAIAIITITAIITAMVLDTPCRDMETHK